MELKNKMGTEKIWKLIITMSVPPLFSMFLQYTYNLVDSAYVAKLGQDALTAISLCFPITVLMNATSTWIGVGTNILVARFLGMNENRKANEVAFLSIVTAFIIGTIITIVSLLGLSSFFRLFTENPVIYQLCMDYMVVCSFMQVPNMVHIVIQKIIQGTGDMIRPMWFQIAGVVFNFVFDPILIFGYWFFPALGIKGAAISTVLGYTLSTILAFHQLFHSRQIVKPKKPERFDGAILKEMFSLGLPSFIMNSLAGFTVTILNLFLVHYGESYIAFFGAYFKIQQLVVMTVNGLIQGTLPIMSFNYGAKNDERLSETFRYSILISFLMMGMSSLLLLLFPSQILNLFSASTEMKSFGLSALRILAIGYIFIGFSNMIATYCQATNHVNQSILIHLARQLILLIPIVSILSKRMGPTGIWVSFPCTEVLTFLMALVFLGNNKPLKTTLFHQ